MNKADRIVGIHAFGLERTSLASLAATDPNGSWWCPDLPGHGARAGDPPSECTLLAIAEQIRSALDTSRASRVRLVGHSMGGIIAALVAVDNPRVISLDLIASPPRGSSVHARRAKSVREGQLEEQQQATIERWFTPRDREQYPHIVQKCQESLERVTKTTWIAMWESLADFPPFEDLAARLPTPHSIVGRADRATPPELCSQIDGPITLIANAGHMVPLTHPHSVTHALRTHWNSSQTLA